MTNERRAVLLAFVFASGYAITDEFHQTFVEGRHGTPVDWLIDSAGAGLVAVQLWRTRVRSGGMMRRVPIDSAAPVVVFAIVAAGRVDRRPHGRRDRGLPLRRPRGPRARPCFVLWSVAVLATARRDPERALHPVVPAVDFALLLALELVAPGHASSACSSPRCS